MNELIGVHFSRQSQLSDPKGQNIRCVPIVHFATGSVDWLCETVCTAWLLANERIPFRWVTDEELNLNGLEGIKLLYRTSPSLYAFAYPSGMQFILAPSCGVPTRPRYPISSDADLQDRHFAPGASLEGFHAIQAFNKISQLTKDNAMTIAEALKRPEVTKLIDVVLAPARAVTAASVPPPVPVPHSTAFDVNIELLAIREHLDNALSLLERV